MSSEGKVNTCFTFHKVEVGYVILRSTVYMVKLQAWMEDLLRRQGGWCPPGLIQMMFSCEIRFCSL